MPKVTFRKENELMRAIREEVVVNPMISLLRLQKNLKERGFVTYAGNPIEDHYLKRLAEKISRQSMREADNVGIKERLAKTRERFRVMIDRLMKIAYWKPEYIHDGIWPPETKDIVKALDTIQKMDLALLQAELDGGIYERHLGTLDVEVARKQPISETARTAAWEVFKNWGIVEQGAEMPKMENGGNKRTIEQSCKALAIIEQPA